MSFRQCSKRTRRWRRLQLRSASERRPDVRALLEAAAARGVRYVLDEKILTLGAGAGGQSWPLDALPSLEEVPWHSLRAIPVAVVTGSNGKTTTVRLIAACARAHGWRDGFNCTDGVFIDRELSAAGDYSGPAGTRRVLRDPRVEAAVLETARGGILRRGLALDHASVAIVTNISPDHFGEYGIDDLAGLADVKLTVAHLIQRDGLLVLNADDALLTEKSRLLRERLGWQPPIGWFALDYDSPSLRARRESGAPTCGVRAWAPVLGTATGAEHDLGAITDMPLTVAAAATYNISNLAGAALAAAAARHRAAHDRVGVRIVRFATSPTTRDDSCSSRSAAFTWCSTTPITPTGCAACCKSRRQLRSDNGRLGMLLGHAGNRLNKDIEELAYVAAEFSPELIVVKEDEGHLRGRQQGEVPAIILNALLRSGLPESAVPICPSEVDAASLALDWARPGDAVVLLIHASDARVKVLEMLRSRSTD